MHKALFLAATLIGSSALAAIPKLSETAPAKQGYNLVAAYSALEAGNHVTGLRTPLIAHLGALAKMDLEVITAENDQLNTRFAQWAKQDSAHQILYYPGE